VADLFLRFVSIEKAFGPKKVLRGVNLEVVRGETVVVLGGSGSGKSVLLRHAVGLFRPDAGQVFVDGVEISELREDDLLETRKKVGMLFQSGALFDSMTVGENVSFALVEHTDWDEAKVLERAEEVLRLVELEGVLELMPSDLSGGMRKRVALARAIALAPAAILYDEPTTGLDPITANTINRLIRSLQARLGVTSIVVTHDIQSAFAVGDRIAFLHEGRILFHGTTADAKKAEVPLLRNFLQGGEYA
jgi:phospholipid/cholesterol/gamma-HCH transport system ATP-binding protein